jgi:hypothetical protein
MKKLSAEIVFDFEDVQEKQKIKDDVNNYDWGRPKLSLITESREDLLQVQSSFYSTIK